MSLTSSEQIIKIYIYYIESLVLVQVSERVLFLEGEQTKNIDFQLAVIKVAALLGQLKWFRLNSSLGTCVLKTDRVL